VILLPYIQGGAIASCYWKEKEKKKETKEEAKVELE